MDIINRALTHTAWCFRAVGAMRMTSSPNGALSPSRVRKRTEMENGNGKIFADGTSAPHILFLFAADEIEAGVLAEYFGDFDAVALLVVFEDGGNDAGQCETRTVEGVTEACTLVAVLAET